MADVCVVIPTHNRADWIAQTVESARAASRNAEIIVVDDASTDRTPEICRTMAGIRYIRLEENIGTSAARNLAIRETECEFIAFLDDDDLRLPGSLDPQIALLKQVPDLGMVYGRTYLGDSRYSLPIGLVVPEECPRGDIYWSLLEGNFIATSTVVVRKDAVAEAGWFDPALDKLEDYDLWIRIAERSWIDAVPEPVSVYRVRGETSGQKTSDRAAHERQHKRLHRKLLSEGRAARASWWKRRRAHARHMDIIYGSLIHDSALALINANPRAARDYLLAAVRLSPFHLKAHVSLLWLFFRDLVARFK
jgi:glycosyltransferase involved in cell wall biosynthesis